MPSRSFALSLALLALVAAVAPVAGLSASPAVAGPDGPAQSVEDPRQLQAAGETTEKTMRVEMQPDGDARWQITAAFDVESESDATVFEEMAADFEASANPLGLDTYRTAAERAGAATGRPMEITGVERSHALDNGTGTLSVSFTWTNFGETEGEELAVRDAFNTTSGTWLPSLPEGVALVVVPPSGYGLDSVPTGPGIGVSDLSNGAARWVGPQSFGTRGPWVVYSGDAATPTPSTPPSTATGSPEPGSDPGAGPGPGTTPGGPDSGLPSGLVVAALVLLGGISAAVLAVYVRRDDDGGLGGLIATGDDETAGSAAQAGDAADAGSRSDDSTAGQATPPETESDASDTPASGAGAASAAGGADADDEIDEELLSDEERVERLLERNGGRMKQANIVKETGWSNAKVSQLLSSMDDEGRIDKLRIGRENLISFPDEDVTDIDDE